MAKFTVQHYLWPLVSGTALSAEYTRPALADSGLEDLAAWGCAFALSGFVAFSIYHTFKYRNRAAFCVVLFLILLLPASNLLVRLEVIGAERFLYLPSIGFCIALGFLVDAARRGEGIQRIGGILLIILGLWYGFCTYERSNVWRTEESFWKTTVQDAPQSPRSWNGWGVVLMNQRKLDEAINAFTKALGLNRMLLDADYNLATCFFLKGNYATAMRGYLYVAQAKPNDLDTLYHLAMIAEHEKGFRLAAAYYERILRINSLDRTALRNLILDHCRMGNIPACRVELEGYLHGALPEENNNDLRVFLQKLPR